MAFLGSATIFQVSDLDTSLRYYTSVLGFRERFRFGDFAGVQCGEVQIQLSRPRSTNKQVVGQGSIYIFAMPWTDTIQMSWRKEPRSRLHQKTTNTACAIS